MSDPLAPSHFGAKVALVSCIDVCDGIKRPNRRCRYMLVLPAPIGPKSTTFLPPLAQPPRSRKKAAISSGSRTEASRTGVPNG